MPVDRWRTLAAFAALGLAAMTVAHAQAQPVGRTSAVRPDATQAPPGGQSSTLQLNEPIVRNARLDTTQSGALEVVFADSSKFSLGPNSNAVVDEFVYAGPGAPGGAQSINVAKGVFRFVSGAVPKEKVKLKSATVTIGIRGTDTACQDGGGASIGSINGKDVLAICTVYVQQSNPDTSIDVTVNSSGATQNVPAGKRIIIFRDYTIQLEDGTSICAE